MVGQVRHVAKNLKGLLKGFDKGYKELDRLTDKNERFESSEERRTTCYSTLQG